MKTDKILETLKKNREDYQKGIKQKKQFEGIKNIYVLTDLESMDIVLMTLDKKIALSEIEKMNKKEVNLSCLRNVTYSLAKKECGEDFTRPFPKQKMEVV